MDKTVKDITRFYGKEFTKKEMKTIGQQILDRYNSRQAIKEDLYETFKDLQILEINDLNDYHPVTVAAIYDSNINKYTFTVSFPKVLRLQYYPNNSAAIWYEIVYESDQLDYPKVHQILQFIHMVWCSDHQ